MSIQKFPESEFRLSGKDKQWEQYLAVRRLHIAIIGLVHTIARPIVEGLSRVLPKI